MIASLVLSFYGKIHGSSVLWFYKGKEVKTALEQIEEVKNRCRGNQEQNDILFRKVEQARSQLPAEIKEKVRN